MEKIDVLKEELVHVREALSRTMGTLYTLYGILVPALVALLAIYGGEAFKTHDQDILGFAAIALFSIGSVFSNVLWIDSQKYLRYLYVELMPRMYRFSDMDAELNFMQFVSRDKTAGRFPHIAFNLLSYVGISVVSFGFMISEVLVDSTRAVILTVVGTVMFVIALSTTITASKSFYTLKSDLSGEMSKDSR